ncbi:hypothetical protein MASR1M90_20330 [Desulfovibrionales bacterium]
MHQPSADIFRSLRHRQALPMQEQCLTPSEDQSNSVHHLTMGTPQRSTIPLYGQMPWESQYFDILSRPQEVRTNSWAVCWSDLMMTMFVMFAALYIFQTSRHPTTQDIADVAFAPAAVQAPIPAPDDSPLVRFYDQVNAALQRAGLESIVEVRLVPEQAVHFRVDGDQFFDPGKSVLKARGRDLMRTLSDALRQTPYYINISGYAARDDTGPRSWELASARSGALVRILVQEAGVPLDRMILLSHVQPDSTNTASETKTWTRRAEIVVSLDDITAPLPPIERDPRQTAGISRWIVSPGSQGE